EHQHAYLLLLCSHPEITLGGSAPVPTHDRSYALSMSLPQLPHHK
ncbi:hypothetical protein HMPREF9621_02909, partial [Cutibacterium modestum HL037PA2]